jgi:hypothetical protein
MVPRLRLNDPAAVDDLLRLREGVVTHADLLAAGMALSTICTRIRRTGAWQRLYPGVVLAHNGRPSVRERLLGALAYAGEGAVLTGGCALRLYGLRSASGPMLVHVLVPHERHRQGRPGLVVERTRSAPEPRTRGGLPVAPPARAVVDACRNLESLDDVRELVAEAVQSGTCTIGELADALEQAARQRSALPREVLREVGAGVRSAAEARIRTVFDRHGLPQPLWNWSLYTADGEFVGTPDGLWEKIGGAMQIDSMAWHLSPAFYKATQRRQRALTAHGVPVLVVAPGDVYADERGFVAQVREFLRRYAGSHLPDDLIAVPPGSGRPGVGTRADKGRGTGPPEARAGESQLPPSDRASGPDVA